MKFALFFMAEYQKMIAISMIAATLFFGGYREFWFLKDTFLSVDAIWNIGPWQFLTWTVGPWQFQAWFLGPIYMLLKVIVLLFFMIWIRATWPRIRYDRLMSFGWKVLLPLSLAVVFISAVGVLVAQQFDNDWYLAIIPILSSVVGLVAVGFVDQALRRKSYASH